MAEKHLVSKHTWLKCKKLIEEAREYPIAVAVLKNNQWVVQNCPYCGKKHFHGAGGPEDDPTKFLGHRSAHCDAPGVNTFPGYMVEDSAKLNHGLILNYRDEVEELLGITL